MGGIENFFVQAFHGNPTVATLLISMIPVIELRGAIPFGVSTKLWGSAALNIWQSLGLAVLGNIIVAAVILALLIPVFNLLRRSKFFSRFVNLFESKFKKSADKIDKQNEYKKMLGIFLFVAIPLPLTGVWTGSAVAVFLGLPYFKSLLSVCAGAVSSGLIMVAITVLFGSAALGIFYFFCFIAAAMFVVFLVIVIIKKPSHGKSVVKPHA